MKKTSSKSWLSSLSQVIENQQWLKSLALLGMRFYLFPIFFIPGWQQLNTFEQTIIFLGDDLHLPQPMPLAVLLIATQLTASIILLLGLMTRLSALLLSIVIVMIMLLVQIDNGWNTIIEYNLEIDQIITLVQEYGNYDNLTQKGDIMLFANGIEQSISYLLMLLILFCYGGGKISIDGILRK
jgi:uncharacterized membrane protein YphA (DoxX/SURF4 family)